MAATTTRGRATKTDKLSLPSSRPRRIRIVVVVVVSMELVLVDMLLVQAQLPTRSQPHCGLFQPPWTTTNRRIAQTTRLHPRTRRAHTVVGTNASGPKDETYDDDKASLLERAARVRLQEGHAAAVPLYQELLRRYPDRTAAVRIAASWKSPARQSQACAMLDPTRVRALRTALSDYTHAHVRRFLLGDPTMDFCSGPVYVTPVAAGTQEYPLRPQSTSRLEILICLFLLGFVVARDVVVQHMGEETWQLLQDLGLAFPCEVDPHWIVPHVHLFPLDLSPERCVLLVTDWHPRVLGRTTVGVEEHGAVMYIGPDSLALVQHLPLDQWQRPTETTDLSLLDLCCGSGIQAIASLVALQHLFPAGGGGTARATCVDVNPRALQFAKFNALLNGVEVETRLCNLLTEPLDQDLFDLILANPPFVPDPTGDRGSMPQRYGLFSSGGPNGEDVLQAIVQWSSRGQRLHCGGWLAVVSEFINPPTGKDDNDDLLHRIQDWWGPEGNHAIAVLFTNQFPVSAETYAKRRSSSEVEGRLWLRHLQRRRITHVSPGLLYLQRQSPNDTGLELHHECVPRSPDRGSLWSPNNADAVAFTRTVWNKLLRSKDEEEEETTTT